MAFSSGTYTLPGAALNTGDTVSATENNTFRNDVATAFNLTMLRNGTSTATANLPMGGFKLTGLGNGTSSGDSLAYGQTADAVIYGLTVGRGAGSVSTNTAVGYQAAYSNTTGARLTALGYSAGYASTGSYNAFIGSYAGQNNTGTSNTAVGDNSLNASGSGSYNSAIGQGAMSSNTSGANNVAVGYWSLLNNTTASYNTAVGYQAGYSNTTGRNSTIGAFAGYSITTGTFNTLIGDSAGYNITTGSKNTILGTYNGNQGGLDIRTASNYIVLSDGDGNPRGIFDGSGNFMVGTTSAGGSNSNSIVLAVTSGYIVYNHLNGTSSGTRYAYFEYNGSEIGSITQNGTTGVLYNLTSDYRLKNNQQPLTGAKEFVMALQPKKWQWWDGSGEGVGFIAHEFMEVAKYSGNGEKDAVDENGSPVYQSIQPSSSEVMANLVSFIQEQQTIITQLQADVAALKGTQP